YQNDILPLSSEQIKCCFAFMKWDYEFKGFVGDTSEEQVFHLTQTLKDKESVFCFLLVVCIAKTKNELIIPKCRGIRKLLQSSSTEEVRNCISYLVRKTKHYNEKQDSSIHPFILPILKVLGNEFLKQTGFLGLGVYGSFALGTTNEYSDLDLMIVVHKPYEKRQVRKITNEFFKRFIPIPIDIKVTSIEDMANELTIGMKKTVKGIAGEVKWKR
ncbi:MAG: nucleotidyltransferase domain-containing protein, partial [Anaeroplasmataceae bacterium]|nr:nucleotidyltransferase domain-containing protein [Anaeroplasmataceae bacterium]